ncbi:MAG TPA: PQQ-dependent sugar dehydrogenase [Tepidisphaeraceae bacterium]|nr:PQQ-dependent sugar dehydrogenase [Tepidisphaeraceae bacterium]
MPELGPGISGNWSAVIAFPNLAFKNALGLSPLPGTSRLVVWEREGRVWSFENHADASEKKLILDISNRTQGWDDSGLLGLAFHPNFTANHYVYVWYAWVPPGTVEGDPNHRPRTDKPNHDRLSRFTLDANGVAIPDSELVLIDQQTRVVWHKGGGMFFHPKNGFLYLTVGDDEDGSNSQRIDGSLLGGLLRIDVDQRGGSISHPPARQPANGKTAGYFIPNDNPFVGKPNALEEFYGIGLRSPHRMTYDNGTGRIFIGDVGDGAREEVDVIEPTDPAGLNFQWPMIEGLRGDLTPPFLGVNKRPIIDYDHGEGNAIIGGYVYRGKNWADDLGGRYIFGDNGTGKIWAMDERTSPVTKIQLCQMPFGPGPNSGSNYTGLSSFGLDADGELYLCQMSSQAGHLYRLERTGPPAVRKPFPKLLSQTGAFADTAKMIPAPGLVPYTVNSPLWSDGAVKSRWVAVPGDAKVTFAEKGEWAFPNGTVFVKHFELAVDDRHPEVHRRLETRLLVRDASGSAYGVTYKWRPDNSDAELLSDSLSEDVIVHTDNGGARTQSWYYPSQTDCIRCHTPAAGYVLGPKTRQLNGDFSYPQTGIKDNQIRAWSHLGLFNQSVDDAKLASLDKLVHVSDSAASIEARARSYLDSNCSQCHRPGGVHALWDARYDTPLPAAAIINAGAINRLNIPGARVIRPGDSEHSVMYRRINTLDPPAKMPPLARNTIDPAAASVIGEWIQGMPPIGALPKPWIADDIGAVGQPGDTLFMNNTFVIRGSGNDIWDNADGFQYLYQPLHGNGTIVARVTSITDGDGWQKAGVMIREKATPDARHAFMAITRDQGAAFQRRAQTGSSSEHTPGANLRAPAWVRLQRAGNTFTASVSQDGQSWQKVGDATIEMSPDALVGLAVTAHNNGATSTAIFEGVRIEP